ncbi:uncharacterized protein BO80DRAFT_185063 [Aspergillus ibericus CBS 121593]|uniref:F-box domain-containing protein n=1 Tax=Aspergillus ibericus CBS 121593 TaxID=1448316 RepID=A0A395GSQ5_9EURO|nr:hypothetical protein BO80DRAFT_185063 [Aspergillus ibericus CBS 121593]RAK97727.1 hypothetical protein BO80DRAFT_185063 [Aspergillus ibericus CBS 121593]
MSLLSLPTELVSIVCSYLEQSHWCALRLACRSLYAKSLDAFAIRVFKTITFLVTTDSLRRLKKIAAHDFFRRRVQELWVVPELFGGLYDAEIASSSPIIGRRLPNGQALTAADVESSYATYQAIVADHLSILEADTFSDVLKICLESFENLAVFGLRYRHVSHLASKTDTRCLGLRRLEEQLNCNQTYPLRRFGGFHTRVARSHALAFSAFARAAIASNQGITKLYTCRHQCCGLTPQYLTLTPEQYESLLPLLNHVKNLHLCICTFGAQSEEIILNYLLEILAATAPSLEVLTFSTWNRDHQLSPPDLSGISRRIHFTRLAELHLHEIEIASDAFQRLVRSAAPTLKTLTLKAISLTDEAMSTVIYRDDIERSWQQVLDFFRDELSLQSLHMVFLFHRGQRVEIIDRSSQLAGNLRPNDGTRTFFSADRARISFKDWVGQLRPNLPVITEVA